MQIKEALQFALALSDGAVMPFFDQVSGNTTTFPTPNGGCHPLWVLGHLTFVESGIPTILFGDKNPLAEWHTLFGENSRPSPNPKDYPPFAEIRDKYTEVRAKNLALLASFSEEDLTRHTQFPPQGREQEFATFASTFLTLAIHQAMHRSHLTDALRAANRKAA